MHLPEKTTFNKMGYFKLQKQRMNRWMVDPRNPTEADEYTGTYHTDQFTCNVKAVVAVDTKERISFEIQYGGQVYIDRAAVERDFVAYLDPAANSAALRSLQFPGVDAPRRPLEIIAGEVVESPPRRFLSSVASRVRGLLPGYKK